LPATQAAAAEQIRALPASLRQLQPADPPYDVRLSKELKELIERTRRNLAHV